MNNDELMIIGNLDQSVPVDANWALDKVETLLNEAIEEGNADKALKVCEQLIAVGQISGLALAKALYIVESNWDKLSKEPFSEITATRLGIHQHTVERYVKVWKLWDNNAPEELKQRNMAELIPIANAVDQGYEITADQWDDLLEAPDRASIAEIIREDIKGEEPRKTGIQIFIDNIGTLWAYNQDSRYFVGSLEIDSNEEVTQKAIKRIKNESGIMEAK